MAEPLKNHFDARIPRKIASQVAAVHPAFPVEAFLGEVLTGYEPLSLMERGRHIAAVLRSHLPADYSEALAILLRSVGDRPVAEGDGGMASFLYLPHTCFVDQFGLDHFEPSMRALYLLTQRFTGEFSIRPFIERYESETLALLHRWAEDPDPHVRRLVSEGTRPRLPWAARLRRFQKDPAPVLALLERLRDDPEELVRRSVANNLNDIGKDHPDVLISTARRWLAGADDRRRALIRHALRTLVKQGNAEALAMLGFGEAAPVSIERVAFVPPEVSLGEKVTITFEVRNTAARPLQLLIDLRVHFVKATGRTAPKVFKLKAGSLAPGEMMPCRKTVSLEQLTTRRHYVGRHPVEALVNGDTVPLGAFVVKA